MPNGILAAIRRRLGIGIKIARPTRKAYLALRRAGYTYHMSRGGTVVTGRTRARKARTSKR